MDTSSTIDENQSSNVDISCLASRVEGLKDEILSLHQEILTMKQSVKDMEETKWKTQKHSMTGKLRKGLEKVDAMQKVFNRMVVNGHKNDLDEESTCLKKNKSTGITDIRIIVTFGERKSILNVKSTLTITEFKSVLEDKTGIPLSKQILQFGDTTMTDDGKTLKDCGIEDESMINIMKTDIQIIVTFGERKSILDVKPTLTITEFKSVLEDKTGIPLSKQILQFGDTTMTDDGKTLKDCGIEDESMINIMKTELQILVRSGKMKWSLDVKPTLTVTDLKAVLENKSEIPLSKQILKFGQTILTNDDKTLKDYGIDDESVIILMQTDMTITVVQTGKENLTLDVRLSHTIREIKSVIERRTDIHSSRQELFFEETKLTDEAKTLKDYEFQNNSEVHLSKTKRASWQIAVDILSRKKQVRLDVTTGSSVLEIINRLYKQTQMPIDEHEALLFNDDRLDPSKLLVEYGIRHDSVLKLLTKSEVTQNEKEIKIFVTTKTDYRDPKCRSRRYEVMVPLNVYPSTLIEDVKHILHLKTQMYPLVNWFTLDRIKLDNGQSLSGCNISEFTTLVAEYSDIKERKQIRIKVFRYCVEGKAMDVMMDLSNSLWDLKCFIEDKWGLVVDSNKCILNGVQRGSGFQKINPGLPLTDSDQFGNYLSHDRVTVNKSSVQWLELFLF